MSIGTPQYSEISHGFPPLLWANDPLEELRLSLTSSNTRSCLCSLVSSWGTNMARTRNMNSLASSIRQAKPSSELCIFLEEYADILHVFVCATPCREFPIVKHRWTPTEVSPHFIRESQINACVLYMTLSSTALCSISHVTDAVFFTVKQNSTQMRCSCKRAIRKSRTSP